MKTTQLIAEHIVIGGLLLICTFITFCYSDVKYQNEFTTRATSFKDFSALIFAFFFITAYSLGFFINILEELVFKKLIFNKAERYCLVKYCGVDPIRLIKDSKDFVNIDRMRHHIYTKTDDHNKLEYHKSTLRLARGISLASILFLFILLLSDNTMAAVFAFFAFLVFIYCYFYRVVWFTRSTYDSCHALIKQD